MKTIPCILPPVVEPTFNTPQQAMAYRAPRNARLEKDLVGLRGRAIEGGSWSDSHFEVTFSNGKSLRFELDGTKVVWSVGTRPQGAPSPVQREVEAVTLELRSGATQRPRRVHWDRNAVFRSRIGRRFKKVFAGETCLWLYTEGQSSLLYFSRLIQGPREKDLLYWTEEQ